MYEIAIEDTFDAAHCLPDDQGACKRLHGHTYRVQARFRFAHLEPDGMAMDFRKAKAALKTVIEVFDHQYMNDLPAFSAQNPTAENIAKLIHDRLRAELGSVSSVSVWETPTSCATYFED